MTLSGDLWNANQDVAQQCLEHPLVQGIASGKLSTQRFAYYVSQDIFFLEALAHAYAIAAIKAPDWDGFRTFHSLVGDLIVELKDNKDYVVNLEHNNESVEAGLATRRYTDFLLATAWSHDAGLTAVAVAPCARLYVFLGQNLAKNGIPIHSYSDWIRVNSSREIEAATQRLEELVDRYANDIALVRATYRYGMVCEHDFFQEAWTSGE